MAKTLSASGIVALMVQPIGDLKPGDLADIQAALSRVPGGQTLGDLDGQRSQERTVSEILTGA